MLENIDDKLIYAKDLRPSTAKKIDSIVNIISEIAKTEYERGKEDEKERAISDDLINKKETLTLLRKRSQQLVGIYGDLGGALSGAARLIDELPTADRPQGKWIDKGTYAECSNCGTDSGTQYDGIEPVPRETNYCPNCGARMKGADNE